MEKPQVVSVLLPTVLYEKMQKAIDEGIYMNRSDFMRDAVRKLEVE